MRRRLANTGEVPCVGEDETVTSLASVAAELGFDELSLVSGGLWNAGHELGAIVRARTPQACSDDACTAFVKSALETSLVSAEAGHDEVWTLPGKALGVSALIARRGDTFSSVTTTSNLRTFLGELDTPWKAHLFLLATEHEHDYDVSCRAYVPSGDGPRSYVRVAGPIQLLGVLTARNCSADAEAERVLLAVDRAGASSVVSSATIWKGATDCID